MKPSDHGQAHGDLMEQIMAESFSGVVVVQEGGRTLIEYVRGSANRETGEPNRLDTRFATASAGKMFTGTCLVRLAEAGLCRLEQPLVEVVPWLGTHFDAGMTLASLLSHRSGLGDYLDDDADLPFAGMDVEHLDCPKAFLPYVLQAPRGTAGEFFYSSAGYVLLGLAIEELTGKAFPEAMAHWVLEPAGLWSSGFPAMDVLSADLAVGYLPDGRSNAGHLPHIGGSDGGLVTTAADLLRFFSCLRTGDFISDTSRQFLWNKLSRVSEISCYGHGFYLTTIRGEYWPGHTGSDPGISARVAFSPTSDSSIIVLCNCQEMAFRVFRLAMEYMNTVRLAGGGAVS